MDLDTDSAACYSRGVLLYGQAALEYESLTVRLPYYTHQTTGNLLVTLNENLTDSS